MKETIESMELEAHRLGKEYKLVKRSDEHPEAKSFKLGTLSARIDRLSKGIVRIKRIEKLG